jgi:hypothetical protein
MPEYDRSSACEIDFSLSALHRRTIGLQVVLAGRDQLLMGRGFYEQDLDLGGVLRIKLAGADDCEFLIVEDFWDGEILPGDGQGCDFLLILF